MAYLKMVRSFFSLDLKTMLLFMEAYTYLGWARLLMCRPFSKVAPALGMQMHETPSIPLHQHKVTLRKISQAIEIMSKYTFWESKCLVKAIVGMKMLERRNIESTLYLGTAKDESGGMVAHAWLRSGTYYVIGAEVMDRFIVVGKFAKILNEGE